MSMYLHNEIAADFRKGKNFKIGKFCIVEEGVEVGDNVEIGNYVLLKPGTKIGNDCFIDSYVRSSGDNIIQPNVTVRFGATLCRKLSVGNGSFLAPNVMTIFEDKSIVIASNVNIGTAAVLGPGVSICAGTTIGALSFVNRDITVPGTYGGVPAKRIK